MSKVNCTVAETQLKARRTSLGKKSKEELVAIILRKDKTERALSEKIKTLKESVTETTNAIDSINRDYKALDEKFKVTSDRYHIEVEKNGNLVERLKNSDNSCVDLLNNNLVLVERCKILRRCFVIASLIAISFALISII